jgi:hypothetical protein
MSTGKATTLRVERAGATRGLQEGPHLVLTARPHRRPSRKRSRHYRRRVRAGIVVK